MIYRIFILLCTAGLAASQQPPQEAMERTLQNGMQGRWWANPQIAGRLGLTPDQQKKMDDHFQLSREHLRDLAVALDKEESRLEPMVQADQPDAAKIREQIDRIAQARSDLERANANMLLEIRLLLTPGQWRQLRNTSPQPRVRKAR
jgi:Spy/CpxP family protein refolding chaperone